MPVKTKKKAKPKAAPGKSKKSLRPHTRYRLNDNTIVPGVTTIIGGQLSWNKQMLIFWARKEALAGNDPMKVKFEAANIGTLAHYMVECHINSVLTKEKVTPYLDDYSKNDIGQGPRTPFPTNIDQISDYRTA